MSEDHEQAFHHQNKINSAERPVFVESASKIPSKLTWGERRG